MAFVLTQVCQFTNRTCGDTEVTTLKVVCLVLAITMLSVVTRLKGFSDKGSIDHRVVYKLVHMLLLRLTLIVNCDHIV